MSSEAVTVEQDRIAAVRAFTRFYTARLEVLEEGHDVLELLGRLVAEAGVVVRIGTENPITALREASIVAARYGTGDRTLGAIAVLGPTRMQYRESISTVRSVAEHLGRTIERLAG
jgi:heat-inducible transcriptional repressor